MTSNIFETLQNQANVSMGFSSMEVFNAKFKIFDPSLSASDTEKRWAEYYKKKFTEEEQFLIKSVSEYQEKKKKFEKLQKEVVKKTAIEQERHRAEYDFADIRNKRAFSRGNLKQGVTLLKGLGIMATSDELTKNDS